MNKKQKIIIAIFVPVIVFFLTLTIAYYAGESTHIRHTEKSQLSYGNKYHPQWTTTYNPFDWGKTWYIWIISSTLCCFFEYKLFSDKKLIINKKEKKAE